MEVPSSVGETSRRWDDEHLDLASAAQTIAGAATGGFTASVSGPAARFTEAWRGYATATGEECEARAEDLRSAIADFLATDEAAFLDQVRLGTYLSELR